MPVAIVTGASRGLGLALARSLAADGWRLVVDARGARELARAAEALGELTEVAGIAGDITDESHREALVLAADAPIDLIVNNAGILGPSPQPQLVDYPLAELRRVYEVNVLAPLALVQAALPKLAPGARILNITSDAAVEPYPGWGGYGSAKAAVEQLGTVLAAERPELRIYTADPGDMRTRMHQQAFPGEDISDRPPPSDSVPGLRELIDGELPSGRYRAAELAAVKA
jgi:NAD(P)-dependent dehydrogenase (short-subunit alcohol dehydrogenase family)